jgi:alpha/beta superfamily hydrolase
MALNWIRSQDLFSSMILSNGGSYCTVIILHPSTTLGGTHTDKVMDMKTMIKNQKFKKM